MHGPHDGRFAPSPTGELHLGNLRTALAAWLFARSQGARFLVRIDDLDPDRSRPEHERGQLDDLRALGLDWDGEPIRQTDRRARHEEVLAALVAADLAYPCFCTRAEVRAAASAPHGASPDGAYAGTCARVGPAAARTRVAAGEPHCLRARASRARIGFVDLLLGPQEAVVDDFVVRRRDGVPAYNLASIVDDVDLGVGEVVRGSDLAETTARQLWLADALDLGAAPAFAHVPIVLGPDGTRLAKRHGAVSRAQLAERGIDAPRLVALLATSLGIPFASTAGATPRDLLDGFDPARLPRTDVRIDPDEFGDRPADHL